MLGFMRVRIWDVEHGACAMLQHLDGIYGGRLAMIDSGRSATWNPAAYIRGTMGRTKLDYLFITNADRDHMSGLQGLADAGIDVETLYRNRTYTAEQIEQIKLQSGPLGSDAKQYVGMCGRYNGPVPAPFAQSMGGITEVTFRNPYPTFKDTNNLSLVVFIKYAHFKILFPGDLEKPGWSALLQNENFRAELAGTDVLVASHHGRESGFCRDIFEYFMPSCVVISDKPIEHETQQTVPDYRNVVRANGVKVRNAGGKPNTKGTRRVLTTRSDGWIQFDVDDANYWVDTEYAW